MTVTKTGPFGSATFSDEDPPVYRYLLVPKIDATIKGPVVLFGMQNPSKASHLRSDNTVTRCVGFAERMGASKLLVVNMCALISTDPKALLVAKDPVGPENLRVIAKAMGESDLIVAGWGALTKKQRQFFQPSISAFLIAAGTNVQCLGKTKGGDPRHPLYLASKMELVPWS